MRHLHARVYSDDASESRSLTGKEKLVYGLGITAAGAAGGLFLGSLAVSAASSAAVALHTGVGHVFAGGLATSLKTAGLFGLRAVGLGALTAAGAAAGGMVGSILVGNEKKSIPVEDLQKVFDKYDTDRDGFIMNSQLKYVFKDLDLDLKKEEQNELFFKATNRHFDIYGDISYKDYLKLFQVKNLDGEGLREMLNNLFIKVEDSKGFVSLEDVKELLTVLNVNASDEDVEEVYRNVSHGGTGKLLSRLQFLEMFGFEPLKAVSETEESTETLKVEGNVSSGGNGTLFSQLQFLNIFDFEPLKSKSETQEPTERKQPPEVSDTQKTSETQQQVDGTVSNDGSGNFLSQLQFLDIFNFEPLKVLSEIKEPTETQQPPEIRETQESLETLKKPEGPEIQEILEAQKTKEIPGTQDSSETRMKPEIPETQESSEIQKKPEVPEFDPDKVTSILWNCFSCLSV
ncbi:Caltractin [Armadillidium vulgare]|nr:Caltractin [Armadillidium vulgare]